MAYHPPTRKKELTTPHVPVAEADTKPKSAMASVMSYRRKCMLERLVRDGFPTYVDPSSLKEAECRLEQLTVGRRDINEQLCERELLRHTGGPHMLREEYKEWRQRALNALIFKDAERIKIQAWVKHYRDSNWAAMEGLRNDVMARVALVGLEGTVLPPLVALIDRLRSSSSYELSAQEEVAVWVITVLWRRRKAESDSEPVAPGQSL